MLAMDKHALISMSALCEPIRVIQTRHVQTWLDLMPVFVTVVGRATGSCVAMLMSARSLLTRATKTPLVITQLDLISVLVTLDSAVMVPNVPILTSVCHKCADSMLHVQII